MSPRRSAADALDTRTAIISRAVGVASLEGLEGVTIGRLASGLGMSKAGVIGHFGSKETLQRAALEAAIQVFGREVWERAQSAKLGLPRLIAICEAWVDYLCGDVFPGGCFLTAAASEFDGRPGPIRDLIVSSLQRWWNILEREVELAVQAGEMSEDTDPGDVAFALSAAALGLNQRWQLQRDTDAPARASRAMAQALGVGPGG